MPGRFFVFEGIDGCGKTTQATRLTLALSKRGPVAQFAEPGGTAVGQWIRAFLLERKGIAMSTWTEAFLFMASRAQLVSQSVGPALEKGDTVVLDRYYYSTAAYQGGADGLGIQTILDLAERMVRFPVPDLVFVLDVDPAVALQRLGAPRDRVEDKGLEYQRKVREAFLKMAAADDGRLRVIDAAGPVEAVHQQILEEVERVL